jgi:hypothetical protein
MYSKLLLVAGLGVVLLSSTLSTAQQGDNAVTGASGHLAASSAWIDASVFCGTSSGGSGSNACGVSGGSAPTDVCTIINRALLTGIPSGATGAVIDARGVVPPPGISTAQQCSGNPFAGFTNSTNIPIEVLLPASIIGMPTSSGTWILPNNTRLKGVGSLTILIDPSTGNCCSGASMIQMGPLSSGGVCAPTYGISVEHLKLQGSTKSGNNYIGIDNECAQASSYVDGVGMVNIPGIGLEVDTLATDSGPYTNLSITSNLNGSNCSGTSASCVDLEAQTQGLHGLTCIGDQSTSGSAAAGHAGVMVNAGNNSIDDIHVEAYWDGIEIGDTNRAVANVIVSNTFTSTTENCVGFSAGYVVNAVHICGPNAANKPTFGACTNNTSSTPTVSDVAILATSNASIQGGSHTQVTSVDDDVTGTLVAGCYMTTCTHNVSPIVTTVYGLGETDAGGYSRLATSPANNTTYGSDSTDVPTWGVGVVSPAGTPCYTPGALYSNTMAASGVDSVYVCAGGGGSFAWTGIP